MKVAIVYIIFSVTLLAQAPQLFLLKTYKNDMNVTGWVMSEKLDGVRAFWDGKRLISRSGKAFNAPSIFTRGFPTFALDGELWTKRGDFEHIVSIVNTKNSPSRWSELTYNVFDVPNQKGSLLERLALVKPYISFRLKIIEQVKITHNEKIKIYLNGIIKEGGEGVVLRNPSVQYYTGRNNNSLKYKLYNDAECRVASILKGKGKYKNLMGALRCDFRGKVIKIGSGFSDEDRKNPPDIGTLINFKYYGLTGLGNPKYPVYLRIRLDENLNFENK